MLRTLMVCFVFAFTLGGCGGNDATPAEPRQTTDAPAVAPRDDEQLPDPAPPPKPAVVGADTVCAQCHQGENALQGRDAAQLAAGIREILSGKLTHPPLGLPDTSDEAILALAERLSAN